MAWPVPVAVFARLARLLAAVVACAFLVACSSSGQPIGAAGQPTLEFRPVLAAYRSCNPTAPTAAITLPPGVSGTPVQAAPPLKVPIGDVVLRSNDSRESACVLLGPPALSVHKFVMLVEHPSAQTVDYRVLDVTLTTADAAGFRLANEQPGISQLGMVFGHDLLAAPPVFPDPLRLGSNLSFSLTTTAADELRVAFHGTESSVTR